MLTPLEYHAPLSLAEATDLLQTGTPHLRPLAGGTALIPALERRQQMAGGVIDLSRLPDLQGLVLEEGGLVLGALVTLADLGKVAVARTHFPVLPATISQMATPLVRNLATLGGNLCASLPHADLVVTLLVLDAEVELASTGGSRRIKLADFYRGDGRLVLQGGELVKNVRIPLSGGQAAYRKLMVRQAADVALANVAVWLKVDENRISAARVAAGGCGDRPRRLPDVEALLVGRPPTTHSWQAAAETATAVVTQVGDPRGSATYRRKMVGVLIGRALAALSSRKSS